MEGGEEEERRRRAVINGVSAASESSARIRSPMEFPWLLYWISFKFVTLSGAMLIAARYESSRLRGVHLSFRGEESLSRARGSGLELHTVLCIRNDSYVRKALSPRLSSHPSDCCFGNEFITSLERLD